jgi:hypothetical protein
MNLKKDGESILLCCGKRRCPALKKSSSKKGHYDLKDDFGGSVSLTREQILIIKDAVKQLDAG